MNEQTWTHEQDQILIQRREQGITMSRIANEIGRTKNAVIGRATRLANAGKIAAAPQKKAPPAINRLVRVPTPTPERVHEHIASMDQRLPASQPVRLMKRRQDQCVWPLGDPKSTEFRFCGAPLGEHSPPYCAGHRRLAYTSEASA